MLHFSSDPQVAESQLRAIIFSLVAFGYIDTDFDHTEKQFIRDHIRQLVERRAEGVGAMPTQIDRWCQHYYEVLDEMDNSVKGYFTESVGEGETTEQFVLAKLKLGCFELLKRFDQRGQEALIATIDELIHADGVVHPSEESFRDELVELVHAPIELDDADIEPLEEGSIIIDEQRRLEPKVPSHPFLNKFEWDFAPDAETFALQSASDMELINEVMGKYAEQRSLGSGKLASASDFSQFAGQDPFLDGHVYVAPPRDGRDYELLVLGDLHGCYSCLKAALMQADFFGKVQAFRDAPNSNPMPYLVLLGDYIDRGRFSYSGVLRTVMQLYNAMPEHVFALRGNHEYYVEIKGKVLAPVRPCEAMDSIADRASPEVFVNYMKLFEAMPNMMVFDRILFVHGGIPRADTIEQHLSSGHLAGLNDQTLRFQMMWSDPSDADFVPLDLQKASARFPFGRKQFQQFMAQIGCKMMIRGHERVIEGFRRIYDEPEGVLLSLFSAGGKTNNDLPAKSNYREVTPMALTVRYTDGITTMHPFELDYARYNDPKYNAFFRRQLG
jgi:hypothetical protein